MRLLLLGLTACGRIGFQTSASDDAASDGVATVDAALATPPSSARTFTAGFAHACAQHGGRVSCWGSNQEGQVGGAVGGAGSTVPTPQLLAGTDWTLVATGELDTCAIHATGELDCWGSNFNGEAGSVMGAPSTGTPTAVTGGGAWLEMSLRRYTACGIRTDHTLWCWGNNDLGQLGQGDSGAATDRWVPTRVGTRTDWATVSVSGDSVCAATTGGAGYCWGSNLYGALGTGDGVDHPSPMPVVGAIQFQRLVAGKQHACGLDLAGGLWCWGENNLFQLGIADQQNKLAPTRVDANVYIDLAPGWFHTCAIRADGTLWCWGDNNQGAYGSPSPESPVAVQIGTSNAWTSVTAGGDFECMYDDGGQYWCMGNNPYGQLGQGNLAARTVPVMVSVP